MKKHSILFSLVIFLLIFICFLILKKNKQIQTGTLTTQIHKVGNGYGYSISLDNKILIMQNYIPFVEGEKSFCTEAEAQNIADLVKQKIKKGKNPSITLLELKSKQINFNCATN